MYSMWPAQIFLSQGCCPQDGRGLLWGRISMGRGDDECSMYTNVLMTQCCLYSGGHSEQDQGCLGEASSWEWVWWQHPLSFLSAVFLTARAMEDYQLARQVVTLQPQKLQCFWSDYPHALTWVLGRPSHHTQVPINLLPPCMFLCRCLFKPWWRPAMSCEIKLLGQN